MRTLIQHLAAGTTAQGSLFPALVRHLAAAMGASFALVTELGDQGAATVLARIGQDGVHENEAWDGRGSPCGEVLAGAERHVARGLRSMFASSALVAALGIDSYFGVPLRGQDGRVLGHLCVADPGELSPDEQQRAAFAVFASRAAAELERRCLQRTLGESEERFRDLFDEAPIAYVHEDLESRFIRANRTALRTLGVRPDEVVGTVGISLVPDTPDAQRRVREAFESIGRGTDTSGVVLELRRKDDGRPVWIQWWSRPDPSGTYTRTMFIDITERVMMEQEQARLREQNTYLQEEIKSVHDFEAIVGHSARLLEVLDNVQRVARTDSTVLLTGETGTGKELIARAIHSRSPRRDKPLIKLNCAALPTNLVESELFGHEKGAFSGAIARRIGRFELAHGGTIFLDEIGEVPLDVQVKLLRVLQEREFERVGGNAPIGCDVRVIAATNRDLGRAIQEGRFRADLFYRLNVFPVHLPPLRERRDDIPLLAAHFLRRFSARIGQRVDRISDELMARLLGYAWPGNIRELENLVERAVILTNSPELDVDSVPFLATAPVPATGAPIADHAAIAPANGDPGPPASGELGSLEAVERAHIVAALERTGWVIAGADGAAKILDLHPNTLRSRMEKLGIARPRRGGA